MSINVKETRVIVSLFCLFDYEFCLALVILGATLIISLWC